MTWCSRAFEKLIVLMTPWSPQASISLNLDLLLDVGDSAYFKAS